MNDQLKAVNEQFTAAAEEFFKNAKGLETPQEIKAMMLEGIERSKEAYEKFSDSASDASKEYEALVSKAQKSTKKITDKVTQNSKKNTDAVIENFKALLSCGDVTEALKLQTEFVQGQLEAVQKQNSEIVELSKKSVEEIVKASTSYAQDTASKFKPTV